MGAALRLAGGDSGGEAAGRLEAADHVGAAAAALLGAVVFIPVLGLTRSAWLLATLLALALIGVPSRFSPTRPG
jgi:predicted membrane-bound spermidine synthase